MTAATPGEGDNVIPFPFRPAALRRPVLLRRRQVPATYVVRVDLDGAAPPIWRTVRLASNLTLAQLHEILQVVNQALAAGVLPDLTP